MKNQKKVNINTCFIIVVVLVFVCIIGKMFLIGLDTVKVGNISLSEFASNRNTKTKTITARRGTIYSSDGEVLAKDVNSYTVIAYLSPSRTTDEKNPHHVVDKEYTAKMLSPLINMSEERILSLLNSKIESCDENNICSESVPYQVELGPGGRGITELTKNDIDDLGLPGIDFISSTKRYYPNGDFLSYTLGYARMNDSGVFAGEMGLEYTLNDELTGTDGYITYQADNAGYQINADASTEVPAVSGNDVYLTIDTNIQMFAEDAITTLEEGSPSWATVSVMNAKTGEILAVASTPSFNNNTLEISSYYDPFASYEYEPGSVMKIFSFMAAMENDIYDGSSTYKSGSLNVDDYTIKDWNKVGWGYITYDEGFMASSNVAASNLALSMGRAKLKDYYTSLGFGKSTGSLLANESAGNISNIRYDSEVAAASYGQGLTVTALQMLQALSSLANDGTVIRPYIVDKIVNSTTNEIILDNEREELSKVASTETVNKMISLLRGVVDGSSSMSTGTNYYMEGYDIIGKTGTAEIAGESGYLKNTYVKSFGALFPGSDPQIIVYVAASSLSSSKYLTTAVKSVIKNVSTYLDIYDKTVSVDDECFVLKSYLNKDITKTVDSLTSNNLVPIVLGDGDKVISQYPKNNTKLNNNNKVFLLTNASNYYMPNITGWSKSDIDVLCKMLNISVYYEGYGYAYEYSIPEGTVINSDLTLEVKLKKNYE